MDEFVQGYVCACAVMLSQHGEDTMVYDCLSCCYKSIDELRKCGVEESDIQTLMPIIKEIERKRLMQPANTSCGK